MEQDNEHPELCTPFVYGKIYTLMGATQLSMGRPADSLDLLETALKYMGKFFPKSLAKVIVFQSQIFFQKNFFKLNEIFFCLKRYDGRFSNCILREKS